MAMLMIFVAGTFILRFSDSTPGHLAVAYKDPNGQIKNSLVDGTQEHGFVINVDGMEPYVYDTLQELVLKVHPLKFVYQPDGSVCDKVLLLFINFVVF